MINRAMQTVLIAIAIAATVHRIQTARAAALIHPACAIAEYPQETQDDDTQTGNASPSEPFTCQDDDWEKIQYED